MQTFLSKVSAWWDRRSMYFKVFVLALVSAVLLFLPAIIEGKGYFFLVGDFNAQQIPFYQLAHDSVRAGEFGWSWLTDLGANFVTSYTFYLLGSPFFWLTIPFPSAAVPYLIGPLLILKTSLCALFAFCWLKNYVKNPWYAALGGFMYAFCGFAIYNIFYNHFHDVMVFFPLLLLAVDKLVEEGKRGWLAGAVAICALVNYFFFFGEVVFVVLYFVLRMLMKGYSWSWKRFLQLCFEAVLGVMIAAILLLPSVLAILQNERLDNFLSGKDLWVFSKGKLLNIIANFFFPPEFTSKQVFVDGAATRWVSLTAYVPVFGLCGVFAFFHAKKDNWLKTFILVLMLCCVVPVLNSMFVAFNASYYARWYYMLVLVMILATVTVFEEGDARELRIGAGWALGLTVILIAVLGFSPNLTDGKVTSLGLYNKELKEFFLLLVFLAVVLWIAARFLLDERGRSEKRFLRSSIAAVLCFGVLFGNFYIFWGKSLAYSTHSYLIPVVEGRENISLPDQEDGDYRIDTDNSLSNLGMFWKLQNIHCFHSIVPASVVDFYTFIGVERSVNSKPPESQYALRSLVSVRWYFDRTNASDSFGDPKAENPSTLMPGYTYYATQNGYAIWENDYYIPIGFVYDSYTLAEDYENVGQTKYAQMMLKGVLLSEEQAGRYGDILQRADHLEGAYLNQLNYFSDCLKLREKTVDTFEITKKGFTASTSFGEDELVFFSVPWEEGWSAEIDGRPVPIERVNIGFMAVRAPKGEHEIVFTYKTPGLSTGAVLSFTGLLVLGCYLWIAKNGDMIEAALKKNAAEGRRKCNWKKRRRS